jgi:hypothetical protein
MNYLDRIWLVTWLFGMTLFASSTVGDLSEPHRVSWTITWQVLVLLYCAAYLGWRAAIEYKDNKS